jgi:hypothetical protein
VLFLIPPNFPICCTHHFIGYYALILIKILFALQEGVFRFGVIRNPKKIETKKLDLISIKTEYDKNNPQSTMIGIKELHGPLLQIKEIIDKRNKNLIFFREADFVRQNKELFKFSQKFETITSIHQII